MQDNTQVPVILTRDGHIAFLELNRPEHNFFDVQMIECIADHLDDLEHDSSCRVVVLQAGGRSFCAGANFSGGSESRIRKRSLSKLNPIYQEAARIFRFGKPIVAAIEGAAIGGGLGVALTADFRVSCVEARFSANFNHLGFHPGIALTYTLPALIGKQWAAWMFYTGARIDGQRALELGLVDFLVDKANVRSQALALAQEIATSSPRAVQSTRRTLNDGRLTHIYNAIARESREQAIHFDGEDIKEGIKAMAERRAPKFVD